MTLLSGWNPPGRLFSNKNESKWLVTLLEIILVLLLAKQLADISWQLAENVFMPAPENHRYTPPNTLSVSETASDYSDLTALHLFGKVVVEQPEVVDIKPENLEQIPVSKLRAKVTGLVAHPNEHRALTVIENSGQQKTYRIGDEIYKSSATIEMIYWDRVIINNRGKQEALLLYPDDKRAARRTSSGSAQPAGHLKALRQQVLSNPASLMEMVSISPVRADGALKGYRINPKQHHQLFAQAGLKPNDLATAINGYDLTDPAQAMNVLNRLKTLDQVALTVERQGQLYQIDLSL